MEADRRRREGELFPDPCHGGRPLGNILRKACAYRGEDRYQKASDFRKDLRKLLYIEEDPEEGNSATLLLPPEGEETTVLLNHKGKQIRKDSEPRKTALFLGCWGLQQLL